jgi:hypothetical protein
MRSHQHSTSAANEGDEAIGKSVAGNTTKIHMAVDTCRLLGDKSPQYYNH